VEERAGTFRKVSGIGVVVLTEEAQERTLVALRKRQARADHTKINEIPVDLKNAIGARNLTWDGLFVRVRRCRKPGARFSCIDLAARVLRRPKGELTELANPSAGALAPAKSPSARTVAFHVDCPDIFFDHRLVLVGQLPREGLVPAVVVQPQDGTRLWYPQASAICVKQAFAALVHIGNPFGIGHLQDPPFPVEARIRIYVLSAPVDLGPNPIAGRVLTNKLRNAVVGRPWSKTVTRPSTGMRSLQVLDEQGRVDPPGPQILRCKAPVALRWEGDSNARVEVRSAIRDVRRFDLAVTNGLVLTRGARNPWPELRAVKLPRSGLYRIKVYAAGWRTFVDPLHEWWLDIADHPNDKPLESPGRNDVSTRSAQSQSAGVPTVQPPPGSMEGNS
jgi:hypothetical protein